MANPMEEQIKMLVELQELDSEIYSEKAILDSAPERIKAIDAAFGEKQATLKALEDEFKQVQAKRNEKEVELGTKEGTIKKYQAQLFQVKTNKEYTTLENEIAGIKADNSLLEEEILKLFDEADAVKKKIDAEKAALDTEKKNSEAEKKKIDDEKKEIEARYADLSAKRAQFTGKLDKKVLAGYERVLKSKSGLAVVPVAGDACGGCNMMLPPQVINEARMKTSIVTCGNCARILYWKE